MKGSTLSPRRSTVPASSMASTSVGAVIFFPPAMRGLMRSSSGSERWIDPYEKLSSAALYFGACLLFQLVK